MVKGILFDVLDPEKEDLADEIASLSPFHDDLNNETLQDGESLSIREADEVEDFPEEIPNVPKRRVARKRGDSLNMMRRLASLSGHQSSFPGLPIKEEEAEVAPEWKDAEGHEYGGTLSARVVANRKAAAKKAQQENERFLKAGNRWPDEDDREPGQVAPKAVPSDLKIIAERIGADPTTLMYPAWMRSYKPFDLFKQLAKWKKPLLPPYTAVPKYDEDGKHIGEELIENPLFARYAGARWNFEVARRKPSLVALMSDGSKKLIGYPYMCTAKSPLDSTLYYRKGSEIQKSLPGILDFYCFKDRTGLSMLVSTDFMERAEAGEEILVNNKDNAAEKVPLILNCKVTGASLVVKRKGDKSWEIAPNLQGMSIRTARILVDAAAIIAGLERWIIDEKTGEGQWRSGGKVQNPPEMANQLANDGDAWCLLAVATNNPRWREAASLMLGMRNAWYFKMTEEEIVEANRELKKLSGKLRSYL